MYTVSAALEETEVFSNVQIRRAGRFDHAAVRTRPFNIIFQNQTEAEEFLHRCSKLKAFHDFKDLVFRKEYSQKERLKWRALMEELELRKAAREKGLYIKNSNIVQSFLGSLR